MEKLLSNLPDKEEFYYFGSHGFQIESKSGFEEAQLGYRNHPDGTDLTGTHDGDWLPTWYMIGSDTTVGDPFFVDTASDSLPVYTAMHGQGSWDPDLVSKSLEAFFSSIQFLQEKSGQDAELIDPDENTISDEDELEKIKEHILSLCGEDADFFWDCFFEQHEDWIIESEDDD